MWLVAHPPNTASTIGCALLRARVFVALVDAVTHALELILKVDLPVKVKGVLGIGQRTRLVAHLVHEVERGVRILVDLLQGLIPCSAEFLGGGLHGRRKAAGRTFLIHDGVSDAGDGFGGLGRERLDRSGLRLFGKLLRDRRMFFRPGGRRSQFISQHRLSFGLGLIRQMFVDQALLFGDNGFLGSPSGTARAVADVYRRFLRRLGFLGRSRSGRCSPFDALFH